MRIIYSLSSVSVAPSLVGADGHKYMIGNSYIDIKYKNTDFAPRKQSVVDFVVDETLRGTGIGTKLLRHVMSIYDDIGAQVSSLASLKVFYKCGFRNPAHPTAGFEQLKRMLEDDSSVFMAQRDSNGKEYISTSNTEAHTKAYEETGFWGRRAAGCLFLAKDTGRILFAHRSKHVLEPNTYGTWGGAIDEKETPFACIRREIEEETEYKGALKLIPLWVFKHSSGFSYHNFIAVVRKEFEPTLNWENQGYSWSKFGEWPQPLHSGVQTLLRRDDVLNRIERLL